MKESLLEYSLEELQSIATALGEKPFRAKQLLNWLVRYTPIDEMKNLSLAFREKLKEQYREGFLVQEQKLVAKDGTTKYLLRLQDGNMIESVAMHYSYGTTNELSDKTD